MTWFKMSVMANIRQYCNNKVNNDIVTQIKQARIKAGFSQKKVAALAGISYATYQGIEYGRNCDLNSLRAACGVLGLVVGVMEG